MQLYKQKQTSVCAIHIVCIFDEAGEFFSRTHAVCRMPTPTNYKKELIKYLRKQEKRQQTVILLSGMPILGSRTGQNYLGIQCRARRFQKSAQQQALTLAASMTQTIIKLKLTK